MCLIPTGCQPSALVHECREITARTFVVEQIVDGDTLVITHDGEPTSVRFCGVNAPERKDPDGPAATEALEQLRGQSEGKP